MATVAPLTSYTYAAGTCALRLTGQVSPLSDLADRTVLRRSRFQLQLWEESEFDLSPEASGGVSAGSDRPPVFDLSGREPQLTTLTTLVQRYVHTYLQGSTLTPSQGLSQGGCSLAPVGLTRHRLTVAGAEAGDNAAQAVNLSLLQLADLAEVLTQAEQAVEHLPEAMVASSVRRRSRLPLWMGSVAAVLVAAVLGGQWLTQFPVSVAPSPTATTESAPDLDIAADSLAGENRGGEDGTAAPGSSEEASPLAAAESPPAAIQPPSTAGDDLANGIASAPAAPPSSAAPAPNPLPKITRNARPSPSPAPSSPPPDVTAASPSVAPPSAANSVPPEMGAERNRDGLGESGGAAQTARIDPMPEATDSLPSAASEMAPSPMAAAPEDAAWVEALQTTLQENWTPIPGLSTPLQYRMTLAPSGQVLALEPLNAPSQQYLDSETLPQVGTTVPNVARSQPATVEIQLLPSGEVLVQP